MIVFLVLFSLGTWQIYRLDWKEEMINNIETNMQNSPELVLDQDFDQLTYKKIIIEGKFDNSKILYLYSKYDQGEFKNQEGYYILSPFITANNKFIIVNRGWIDIKRKNQVPDLLDKTNKVIGFVFPEHKDSKFFAKNNFRENIITYIDSNEISNFFNLALPHVYIAQINVENKNFQAKNLNITLHNNHLQYAIMWYVLCFINTIFFFLSFKKITI